MWAWGEGAGEELAWEDRRGGSQARQSMKQLTGAEKGDQGEEKGESVDLEYWGMPLLPHPRGLSGMRKGQRLVGQRSRDSSHLSPNKRGSWGGTSIRPQVSPNKTGQSSRWGLASWASCGHL